jgi:hypothetical protein
MSPIGPDRWQRGVDEAIVIASGAVARLIPERQATFRRATIQPRLRLAAVRFEGGGHRPATWGPANPCRGGPGCLAVWALRGASGLLSASASGLPEGIRPEAGRSCSACLGEVLRAPEPLVTRLGLMPELTALERG